MSKRFSIAILLAIILIILTILVGWVWRRQSDQQETMADVSDTPSSSEKKQANASISDWGTYRNEEYGFSMEIPS